MAPEDTTPAKIIATTIDQTTRAISFRTEARKLRPIAGAPSPFYTYFWEFGDGSFSFQKEPRHQFNNTGTFDIRVYATNNYDDGKPSPIRPFATRINSPATNVPPMADQTASIFGLNENLTLKVNAMPQPDEEMVLIIGYRNNEAWGSDHLSGRIVLFQNEVDFRNENFVLKDVRTYHNEKEMDGIGPLHPVVASVTLEDDKQRGGFISTRTIPVAAERMNAEMKQRLAYYREEKYWSFDDFRSGEDRYMFVSFHWGIIIPDWGIIQVLFLFKNEA